MSIDPVVMLAEELRIAERALQEVRRANTGFYRLDRVEKANRLLKRITTLHEELFETEPTSVLGASEHVRLAAQHLPFSQSTYATHLNEIADRLGEATRLHSDLLWLRAFANALALGLCGESGARATQLLRLAVSGAAKPVLIYRDVMPMELPEFKEERLAE
ncbi:MAG TPA: hypothetical protein VHW02_00110 [Rhizomicrobium sp.]|jgi:hypothetical protein|nr:hypothetical protein [Rhizomicrobium sp.]